MISVIGAARCSAELAAKAERVGHLLAEHGAVLVCGGRAGVMEAACRGAQENGGLTIGLLPGSSANEGNPYLTVAIPTGLGHARNALVVQAGEAVLAVAGGYGTLSEIGLALTSGRKVVGLDTWSARRHDGHEAAILQARTPEEAVEWALAAARGTT